MQARKQSKWLRIVLVIVLLAILAVVYAIANQDYERAYRQTTYDIQTQQAIYQTETAR